MDPIATIRVSTGLSQREFAAAVGTSQPTIAAYERQAKSPTWSTIERIADAAGVEVHVVVSAPWTEADRRNLVQHRAIAFALQRHPDRVVRRAEAELTRLLRRPSGKASQERRAAWREWRRVLALPPSDIVAVLVDPSARASALRRASPFRGAISGRRGLEIMGEVAGETRARRASAAQR
jgi:transcriptional regulator with XRE-family HTH domain